MKIKRIFMTLVITCSMIIPVFSNSDFDTAYSFLNDNKYDKAIFYYEKAIASEPNNQNIWWEYIISLRKTKLLQKAIQAGWRALELGPENFGIWMNIGNVFLDTHYWDEAFNAFKKVEKLSTNKQKSIQNFLNLGYEQWIFGDNSGAMKTFMYAYNLDKNHPLTILDIGVLEASTGEVSKGKEKILQALEMFVKENNKQGMQYAQKSLEILEKNNKIEPLIVSGKSFQRLPERFLKQPIKNEALKLIPDSEVNRYFVLNNQTFILKTPQNWLEKISIDKEGKNFTIELTKNPNENIKRFKYLITTISVNLDLNSIKSSMEITGNKLLKDSLENKIELIEIKGKKTTGYAFSLSDKNYETKVKKEDEFPFITQGLIKSEKSLFFFTIFSETKEKIYVNSMLEVIKSIEFK